MPILTPEEFFKGGDIKKARVIEPATNATPQKQGLFAVPSISSIGSSIKDVATGLGKGALDTAIGTSRLAEGLGRGVMKGVEAIDPTSLLKTSDKNFGTSKSANDFIDATLKSQNAGETTGKVIEAVASLFYPVGKTEEATSLLDKGKKTIGASFDGLGSRMSQLGDEVTAGGVKVKDRVADLIVNLDQKTKTALDRTPIEKFQEVVDQGKKALIDDRNKTPLEVVGDSIINGLKQLKDRTSSIGEQKSQYLNQAKVGLKRVGNIVNQAILDTQKIFNGMKIDAGDAKVVKNFYAELKKLGSNPTLKEVDKTIDLLQDGLYKAGRSNAVEVTDRITAPLRKILGKLNSEASNIGGDAYKSFNQQYKDAIEIVTELNARVGKEGGGAGSFIKRLFSPSDARTKELFEKLGKYTGQDYFRDARLSKFVMEALGDARASSLLEQVPTSFSGALGKALDYGVKKVTNPIKAAERYIKKP